jgi:hypothetical protein
MTRCIERRPFKTVADYPLETMAKSNPEPRARSCFPRRPAVHHGRYQPEAIPAPLSLVTNWIAELKKER